MAYTFWTHKSKLSKYLYIIHKFYITCAINVGKTGLLCWRPFALNINLSVVNALGIPWLGAPCLGIPWLDVAVSWSPLPWSHAVLMCLAWSASIHFYFVFNHISRRSRFVAVPLSCLVSPSDLPSCLVLLCLLVGRVLSCHACLISLILVSPTALASSALFMCLGFPCHGLPAWSSPSCSVLSLSILNWFP